MGFCLLLYIVVIISPQLIHHYIYPNLSDDTATHLNTILDGLENPSSVSYAGSLYIGYPLSFVANLFHTSLYNAWMWFNLLILIPVGFTLYFVGSKLVNWQTGLMMLVVPIFVSGGIICYSVMGMIYSLILVSILMPLLMYFAVKYLLEKRIYQLVAIIVLAIVTATFHTSGIYVSLVAVVALVGFVAYKFIKRDIGNVRYYLRLSLFAVGIIILAIISILIINPQTFQSVWKFVFNNQPIDNTLYSLPFVEWVMTAISLPVIFILGASIYSMVKEKIKLSNQLKLYLYFMLCWIVVLLILGYGRVSIAPDRAEADMAIAIGILSTLLFGAVLTKMKDKVVLLTLAVLIIGGMGVQFRTWFRDNSAIKESDRQAILYLNTLDYVNYNCSSTVPYWIYDHLINAKYSPDATDLIIVRNKPMTLGSDKDDVNFRNFGYTLSSQDVLIKSFINGGIEVDIYEKQ